LHSDLRPPTRAHQSSPLRLYISVSCSSSSPSVSPLRYPVATQKLSSGSCKNADQPLTMLVSEFTIFCGNQVCWNNGSGPADRSRKIESLPFRIVKWVESRIACQRIGTRGDVAIRTTPVGRYP